MTASKGWYACQFPERPLDFDVRFHDGITVYVDGKPIPCLSITIDGRKYEPPMPCHGCETAKAAAIVRSGSIPDDIIFGHRPTEEELTGWADLVGSDQ